MANVNIRTPRFYTDHINYFLNRGISITNFKLLTSGSDLITAYQNGSDSELFDMRPTNPCTWNTSANTSDHILINIDRQSQPTVSTNFIAILNHNMASADAKVRVRHHATESNVQDADMGSATRVDATEVLNAGSISNEIITPALDGTTIFTFSNVTTRHIGIQFEGDSTFDGTTDLSIGCIIIGEYLDMPHAPDLSVKRTIKYDSLKSNRSLGGQKYSNMINFGRSTGLPTSGSTSTDYKLYGGRMAYDLSFSYLSATDIMPDDYSNLSNTDDNIVEDLWNMTHGSHTPFIFTADNTSTSTSDYLFARHKQDTLSMTQVAPDVFNISMKIEEEF